MQRTTILSFCECKYTVYFILEKEFDQKITATFIKPITNHHLISHYFARRFLKRTLIRTLDL